jgi:hypothetical protein
VGRDARGAEAVGEPREPVILGGGVVAVDDNGADGCWS